MSWTIDDDQAPTTANLDRLANAFLSANGQLGLRATLDEVGGEGRAGLLINGLYDRVPGKWREPVNAPHPLGLRVTVAGQVLDVRTQVPTRHRQQLDLASGIHSRSTEFDLGGNTVVLQSRRWVSHAHPDLVQAEWQITCQHDTDLVVETGIDGDVWDINGPHLEGFRFGDGDTLWLECQTQETKTPVRVAEWLETSAGRAVTHTGPRSIVRRWSVRCQAGVAQWFRKLATVNCEGPAPWVRAGFAQWEAEHRERWASAWQGANIAITGDAEADLAVRFSLYHLLSSAPPPGGRRGLSIPARGLSGQVYKGAVFWDTELFMLPFFLATDVARARGLVQYRIDTLAGARAKAAQEGYQGAFYAWESQEGGFDACTLFNVNDVFTGRPLRTFFRDKQIHISADVALAVVEYVRATGDTDLLDQGGREVVLACAEFLVSWMVKRPLTGAYELHDVTGPDEYHERVNNDAWTNLSVRKVLEAAQDLDTDPPTLPWSEILEHFLVPQPGEDGVIAQFDRYRELEDVRPDTLKGRQKHPNEYWGCGDGLARWTQVIKQADVVLALAMYPQDFAPEVRRANYEFYEPRTEHGSSLSASAYALVAARLGRTDDAYRYFLKTATIDLTGNSKQYVGDLYIGGTHPAAHGGTWMSVVQGFLGWERSAGEVGVSPRLPSTWSQVQVPVQHEGRRLLLTATASTTTVEALEPFDTPLAVVSGRARVLWRGRQPLVVPLRPRAALFDLDGVLVDTAKYHFQAWRRLAQSLGIDFSEADNEHLKGVNRRGSLQRILALGGQVLSEHEQVELCERKNQWYVELVSTMEASELLPGVVEYLGLLRSAGVRVGLGSASQNARLILDRTGITGLFDTIVDGLSVTNSKPDPEVFVRGAADLGVSPADCAVFEDSQAGLIAAQRAGMLAIGVGTAEQLPMADLVIPGVSALLE